MQHDSRKKGIRKLMLVRQREEIQINMEGQAGESDEELPTIENAADECAGNNENVAENVEEVFLTLNRPGFLESSTAGGGGFHPPV